MNSPLLTADNKFGRDARRRDGVRGCAGVFACVFAIDSTDAQDTRCVLVAEPSSHLRHGKPIFLPSKGHIRSFKSRTEDLES